MKEFTISEVARRAGIRPSAIRFYESSGILPTPHRVSGRRRYDERVLQRLAIIQLAQEAGFTVAEIKRLFFDFAAETPAWERWQTLATRKLAEVDALISRAQQMKRLLEEGLLQCRCLTLEECAPMLCQPEDNGEASG
jgi:MerR family redox-sensitive transcriptional activator SoxR